MIILFTDFGLEGPYIGQVQAVLQQQASGVPVINLFSDLSPFNIQAAAYLLPAYASGFPEGSIFLCVVDPGVGSDRPAAALHADGKWFVGPSEGLFSIVARRAESVLWRGLQAGEQASSSFHGRDVFAPMAAKLVQGEGIGEALTPGVEQLKPDWPDELFRVAYIDRFGNAITGVRARTVPADAVLETNGHVLHPARTFSEVARGTAFWYENSSGLVEIAVNQGRADRVLDITVGAPLVFGI